MITKVVFNTVCGFLYYTGIADNYRARGNTQWPWEALPKEEWTRLFYRSLGLTLFNSLISTHLTVLAFWLIGMPDLYPTDIDKMPSPIVFAA